MYRSLASVNPQKLILPQKIVYPRNKCKSDHNTVTVVNSNNTTIEIAFEVGQWNTFQISTAVHGACIGTQVLGPRYRDPGIASKSSALVFLLDDFL